MNIAMISEHGSPLSPPGSIDSGGQNVYVGQLATELAARGHRVDIFTRREHIRQAPSVAWRPGVRVLHVAAGPARYVRKEDLLPHMPDFAEQVLGHARSQAYDLVHANFFMSGLVAERLHSALGLPYVITFHALGLVRRQAQGAADAFPAVRSAIEARLMQGAAGVVAECPQDCEDMVRLYGAPRARISIVPCGFDPRELWPVRGQARRRLGLGTGEFTILQLGRMVPRKGIDNVIAALALLGSEHGIHARLLVAGGSHHGGPEQAELARLAALARSLGVAAQVHFTGPVPRSTLRYYYSAADVFVSTPWYEPFGITPLEAMACATPVIGAAVGGIRSTVLHGQTGFLVPPRDPQALAARLAQLQQAPWLARRMGTAGWRHVHRHYTWTSVAERICALYQAVASSPPLQERSA
ncbi:glycosyltransferase [Massilia sp. TS11]|uniref:glycosyltransferase n=1 Tax=Massilia sp. TS11 TaxID=2908003 RepID=UPI001EDB1A41|nr:glycosyltransferase [Massilia sp. TS11]MCG2586862.1 glycosyltransferase [Massilia sp. TS11]